MSRRVRILVAAIAVLALVPACLVGAMRHMRHRTSPVAAVHGGLLRERNFFTDLYGVRAGRDVVLFDAGIDTDGEALDTLLAALHAARGDVTHVFLTHGHFDHIAAAPLCTRATIHVGASDAEMMAHRAPSLPKGAARFAWLLPVPPVEASATFTGTQVLALDGGQQLFALPTPGHTPGSFVYLYDGVLIAGDTIQIDGDALAFADPRFTVDVDENRCSIAALRKLLDGRKVDTVCTGHQGCTPEGRGAAMLEDLIARAERNHQ